MKIMENVTCGIYLEMNNSPVFQIHPNDWKSNETDYCRIFNYNLYLSYTGVQTET